MHIVCIYNPKLNEKMKKFTKIFLQPSLKKKNAPHSVNEIEEQLIPPPVDRKQLNQLLSGKCSELYGRMQDLVCLVVF